MQFAKWFFIVSTPIGLAVGLWEGYRLAGGLVFLMATQILVLGAIAWGVVNAVRREDRDGRHVPPQSSTGVPQ